MGSIDEYDDASWHVANDDVDVGSTVKGEVFEVGVIKDADGVSVGIVVVVVVVVVSFSSATDWRTR